MRTSDRKSKPVQLLRVQRELAKALKVSGATVCRYLKNDGWKWSRTGPWNLSDVPAMLRWIAEELKAGGEQLPGAGGDEIRQLRKEKITKEIRVLLARALKIESEQAERDRRLIDTAEVKRWVTENIAGARDKLLQLPFRLAPLVVGKDTPEVESLIDAEIRIVLTDLSNQVPELVLGKVFGKAE
jgi:hypothetical protein